MIEAISRAGSSSTLPPLRPFARGWVAWGPKNAAAKARGGRGPRALWRGTTPAGSSIIRACADAQATHYPWIPECATLLPPQGMLCVMGMLGITPLDKI